MPKVLRITTVPNSLLILLNGQLEFMRQYFDIVGVSSGSDILQKVSSREGIRVVEVEMTRSISPLKDLRALWNLVRIMKKENPEIVHTHTPKAGILGMLAAWLCRIPVRLHTIAGLPLSESHGFKRILLEIVEKNTYRCATKVYPNSFGLKDFILRNKYCSPSKIKVLGNGSSNGIDSDYFSVKSVNVTELEKIRKYCHLGPENFVFIFLGRLVRDKGINELIHAFDSLHRKNIEVRLILVGYEEPELDPLQKDTIDIMHNHPAIINTGYQSDVRPFIAASNVLVLPSYREGLPNVPLQACAMDVPCIVSDINGCNEIVSNGLNGLLIPVKNTEALQIAMERLLKDSELFLKLKSNARNSVLEKYNQLKIWKEIKEEYDNQLEIAGLK
jgi:glycosyltransferase involved in cell wall biosynthesis